MAASLPVVFILTDYFMGRKFNWRIVFEKVPFFLLAFTFGIVAVMAQQSIGATDVTPFTFPQRIAFACYGFITYLFKLVLQLNLSAYYPYPLKHGDAIPSLYYAYLVLFLLFAAFIFYSRHYSRKIILDIGFFSITIFLVLQLLPIGNTIIADRYSYIPSIGIFYLAGEGIYFIWHKIQKILSMILLGGFILFFSIAAFNRSAVWKNEISLWTNVISHYQTIPAAYNNRGNALMGEQKVDEALSDFSHAIELKPTFTQAYYNRGSALLNVKRYQEALKDFNSCIRLDSTYVKALGNRALVLHNEKRYDEAIMDYNTVIRLNPKSEELFIIYNNRGKVFMDKNWFDEAIMDYNKAIELKPNVALAYNNLGFALFNAKRYHEAIGSYSKAIELKSDFAEAYYYRAFAVYYSGDKDAACKDLKKAASLGYHLAEDALLKNCK
jgi:protein O-mannosyl-transferase